MSSADSRDPQSPKAKYPFSLSKGVTTLFACTQALLALANGHDAPAILKRTDSRGVPYVAVLTASSLGASAYLSLQQSTVTAFWWLISLSSAAGLVSWCVLCYGHIRLMEGMRVQGYTRQGVSVRSVVGREPATQGPFSFLETSYSTWSDLPYQAPLQPYLSWFALSACVFVLLFGGEHTSHRTSLASLRLASKSGVLKLVDRLCGIHSGKLSSGRLRYKLRKCLCLRR